MAEKVKFFLHSVRFFGISGKNRVDSLSFLQIIATAAGGTLSRAKSRPRRVQQKPYAAGIPDYTSGFLAFASISLTRFSWFTRVAPGS